SVSSVPRDQCNQHRRAMSDICQVNPWIKKLILSECARKRAMPVVGFLSARSASESGPYAAAFRRGLGEAGYVEGQNATIRYGWAESDYSRLPALAANLVTRGVMSLPVLAELLLRAQRKVRRR